MQIRGNANMKDVSNLTMDTKPERNNDITIFIIQYEVPICVLIRDIEESNTATIKIVIK